MAVESLLAGSRTRCLDARDIFWRPSFLANINNSRHERARKRAARRHVAPRSGSATRTGGSGTTAARGRSQRPFERSTESAIGFCRTRFANEREAIAIARVSRACKRASRLQRAIGFAGVSNAFRQKSTRSTDSTAEIQPNCSHLENRKLRKRTPEHLKMLRKMRRSPQPPRPFKWSRTPKSHVRNPRRLVRLLREREH